MSRATGSGGGTGSLRLCGRKSARSTCRSAPSRERRQPSVRVAVIRSRCQPGPPHRPSHSPSPGRNRRQPPFAFPRAAPNPWATRKSPGRDTQRRAQPRTLSSADEFVAALNNARTPTPQRQLHTARDRPRPPTARSKPSGVRPSGSKPSTRRLDASPAARSSHFDELRPRTARLGANGAHRDPHMACSPTSMPLSLKSADRAN